MLATLNWHESERRESDSMRQRSRYTWALALAAMMAGVLSWQTRTIAADASPKQDDAHTGKPQPRVTDVYPTADVLPENLLRFYIYFTRPMGRENVLSSIKLLDSKGEVVSGAFLNNKFALWSPDGTRLTLLFDPGRVKTGLVAHNRLGRALQANQNYELVIESTLLSVDGIPLVETHRKPFRVSAEDFEAPNIQQWRLKKPRAGSKDSLQLKLNGAHDHLSLAYRIRVKDDAQKTLPGRIDIAEFESVWLFIPEQPWNSSNYSVVVDPLLEDIAGNRLTDLFEKPLANDNRSSARPKSIEFQPIESSDGGQRR